MTRRNLKRQGRDIMRGKPSGPGWLLAGLLLLAAIIAGVARLMGWIQ